MHIETTQRGAYNEKIIVTYNGIFLMLFEY